MERMPGVHPCDALFFEQLNKKLVIKITIEEN